MSVRMNDSLTEDEIVILNGAEVHIDMNGETLAFLVMLLRAAMTTDLPPPAAEYAQRLYENLLEVQIDMCRRIRDARLAEAAGQTLN